MDQPNVFEDSFEESLRSMAPNLAPDTKSRLLFECGMAAAETKIQNRRWHLGVVASVALLVATGLGFILGNSFSQLDPPMADSSSQLISEDTQLTYSASEHTRGRATLAVAMAPSQVFDLLDRVDSSDRSKQSQVPAPIEAPFGTRSPVIEL